MTSHLSVMLPVGSSTSYADENSAELIQIQLNVTNSRYKVHIVKPKLQKEKNGALTGIRNQEDQQNALDNAIADAVSKSHESHPTMLKNWEDETEVLTLCRY